MDEIWKDVVGYEGLYQVSNLGNLKSFKVSKDGRVLKMTNKTGWYFTVVLQGKGKPKQTKRIHRLVAEYFVNNPLRLKQVNHKDLNKQNNHFLNLEWVTCRENMVHAVKNNPDFVKAMIYRNQVLNPKIIIQLSIHGQFISEFGNSKLAHIATGVCARNILQVASKDEYKPGLIRKTAGGFIWKYKTTT